MKTLLIDHTPFHIAKLTLSEGKNVPGGRMRVKGKLQESEVKNGNGRYYSRELWEREMDKYMENVRANRALGELDHPDSSIINLKNVSHNIKKIWWDGDNVMGAIELLPTPSGNILRALFENKIPVGVSSRGMGSLKQMGDLMEVQDDFELLCWDFVSTPSNPGSYMHLVREGKEYNTINHYTKASGILTEILCAKGTCPII